MSISEKQIEAGVIAWRKSGDVKTVEELVSAIYLAMRQLEPDGDEVERVKRLLDIRYGDFQRNAKVAEEIAALRSKPPIDREGVQKLRSLEAGLMLLHRATREGDPHKELTVRVDDALTELRAAITAIGSQSIEGERG